MAAPPSINMMDSPRGDDRSLIFSLADRAREDAFLRPLCAMFGLYTRAGEQLISALVTGVARRRTTALGPISPRNTPFSCLLDKLLLLLFPFIATTKN